MSYARMLPCSKALRQALYHWVTPPETSMKRLNSLFALAALFFLSFVARADWPDHPIKWVVPFTAGGANDLIARAAAEGVSKRLKQPVIIENKPGAGTLVGSDAVAKSKGDGYT